MACPVNVKETKIKITLDQDLTSEQPPAVNPSPSQGSTESQKIDYDFVEEPSQDFFCPVTLEMLTEPHLTGCCGNHLSQEAVTRLQHDGKSCPMCKEPQLVTMADKFYRRKVNEIKVRCPHKKSGCEWVGEVNDVKQHSESCPKRPWQCWHCGFESTYDIGVNEHLPNCPSSPVECPNSCEVGSVARCDLEAHLMECPLQPVTCEYAEVGCDVKVPRRDLDCHMKEDQQQHLLSATLLNLRLTRENTEERNRLLQIVEEKDEQIKEKDETIADLQKQLKQVQDGLEAKVTDLQQQVVKYGKDTQEHLNQHDKHVEHLMFVQLVQFNQLYIQQGFSVHDFTLTEFKKCRAKGKHGDWYSEPFYSHPEEYKFQLNVETKGWGGGCGVYMRVFFKLLVGDHDDKLDWPVTTTAHVQMLNQLGHHTHHEKTSTYEWNKSKRGEPHGGIAQFCKLSELGLNAEKNTQYLKNDCLKFRVYFKACKK